MAVNSSENREFIFNQQDFERIRKMIYDHAGISLGPHKFDMVYSRVARRLRANKLQTFTEYLNLLALNPADEWEAFVNSLTTNLTAFFREPHHFPLLAEHIKKIKGTRPVSLWCSAASTGEEPYSIAMTLADLYGGISPQVKLLATDLDTNVLAKGRSGVYSMDRLEKVPKDLLKRYFLRGGGPQDGQGKVRDELRNMITFRQLNLLDENWPIQGPFDVIFCRNVMIYFDKETQYKILKKFAPLLRPDGLLFAGHSESFSHATDLFTPRGQTVYVLSNKTKKAAG